MRLMNPLVASGLVLLIIAAGILLKQRQAKSCSRHSRLAGALAWGLAAACAGAGILLLTTESLVPR